MGGFFPMSLKRPAPGTRSQKLSTVRPGRLRAASPTNHPFFEWSDMFQRLIFRAVDCQSLKRVILIFPVVFFMVPGSVG